MASPVRYGFIQIPDSLYAGELNSDGPAGYGVFINESSRIAGKKTGDDWIGKAEDIEKTVIGSTSGEFGLTVIHYKNGSKYEGQHRRFQPHGKGVLTYPNGNVYSGNFLEGKKHGCGTMKIEGKGVYKGLWENDVVKRKPNTPIDIWNLIPTIGENIKTGKIEFFNCFECCADFIRLPLGEGKLLYKCGDSFVGTIKRGFPVQGKVYWKDYGEYEGVFDVGSNA